MKEAIAVWWDKESPETYLELDLNIWLSKKKNGANGWIRWIREKCHKIKLSCFSKPIRDNYIEIGLRITNFEKINKIYIYLPFQFSIFDVSDMVPQLKESDIANALFNEKMSVVTDDSSLYQVNYISGEKEPFYASCSEFHEESIKTIAEGCCLTMDIPESYEFSKVIYKRIRINKVETIINEFSENNFIIDGLFKKLQTVEVSINTTRKLPVLIVDKIIKKVNLKSINFFLMTNIFTDITFKSEEIKNSRILELDIWNNYLGIDKKDGKDINKIIAYQWKDVSPASKYLQDYNLFVKFSIIRKQGLIFALSILAIILLGALSGFCGNRLTTYVDNFEKSLDKNETQKGEVNGTITTN